MKKTHWVLDREIIEDAGDVGGDIQVDRAISARFRSDDCPEARFEVTLYATAKSYLDLGEPEPDCPHVEPSGWTCLHGWDEGHRPGSKARCLCWLPADHLACSWKPGTVDVQARYLYRRNGRVNEHGHYESDDADHVLYGWEGPDLGYDRSDGIAAEADRATVDATQKIKDWVANVNKYLHWDGRTNPMD